MAKRKSIKSVWRFLFHDAPTNTNETPYAGGNGSRTLMVYLSWSINEWTRKRYSLNEHAACMHATIDVDSNATKKIDVRQRIAILFDSGERIMVRMCPHLTCVSHFEWIALVCLAHITVSDATASYDSEEMLHQTTTDAARIFPSSGSHLATRMRFQFCVFVTRK